MFFKGAEDDSPDPSKNVIGVVDNVTGDPKGVFTKELQVAGDVLHFLGGANPDTGLPFNPEFFDLKQQFIASMSTGEIKLSKRRFKEEKAKAVKKGRVGTNLATYENYLQTVWADQMIIGGLFPESMNTPEEEKRFRDKSVFTEDQKLLLSQMFEIIQGK